MDRNHEDSLRGRHSKKRKIENLAESRSRSADHNYYRNYIEPKEPKIVVIETLGRDGKNSNKDIEHDSHPDFHLNIPCNDISDRIYLVMIFLIEYTL